MMARVEFLMVVGVFEMQTKFSVAQMVMTKWCQEVWVGMSSYDMKEPHLYFIDKPKQEFVLNRGIYLLWKLRWEALLKYCSCCRFCEEKKNLHKQLPRVIKITYYIQIKAIDHLGEQLQSSAMHWNRIPSVFSAWAKAKWLFWFLQLINFPAELLRMITFRFSVCWVPLSLLVFKE